jgi:hypothetical protein
LQIPRLAKIGLEEIDFFPCKNAILTRFKTYNMYLSVQRAIPLSAGKTTVKRYLINH